MAGPLPASRGAGPLPTKPEHTAVVRGRPLCLPAREAAPGAVSRSRRGAAAAAAVLTVAATVHVRSQEAIQVNSCRRSCSLDGRRALEPGPTRPCVAARARACPDETSRRGPQSTARPAPAHATSLGPGDAPEPPAALRGPSEPAALCGPSPCRRRRSTAGHATSSASVQVGCGRLGWRPAKLGQLLDGAGGVVPRRVFGVQQPEPVRLAPSQRPHRRIAALSQASNLVGR